MEILCARTSWCSQPAVLSSESCWRKTLILNPWSSSEGECESWQLFEFIKIFSCHRIRFPDMVAILNFMYHGEVNVNQEDLTNFLAAAEELRIKGLSQASSSGAESKIEKQLSDHHHENHVPKMKQSSGGSHSISSQGQPPAKKPRDSSPGRKSWT